MNSILEHYLDRHYKGPRRDKPCERCGWRYEGFHVCFDASKPEPKPPSTRHYTNGFTDSHRAALTESLTERWERYRDENRPRDEQIIEKYKAGAGYRALATEFGIAYQTVMGIIKREEAATGETIVRPKGKNIRHTKFGDS